MKYANQSMCGSRKVIGKRLERLLKLFFCIYSCHYVKMVSSPCTDSFDLRVPVHWRPQAHCQVAIACYDPQSAEKGPQSYVVSPCTQSRWLIGDAVVHCVLGTLPRVDKKSTKKLQAPPNFLLIMVLRPKVTK